MKNGKNNEMFLRGTLSISFAVLLTKIMGVLYKVPLSYMLGDEGMGYFNSAYAIYSFLYILCTSGVPKAITLSLADNSDNDRTVQYRIIKRGVSLFIKIGVIVGALGIICAPVFVNIIGSKKSLYTILVIMPSIIFVSVSGVLRGCMNYYNRLSSIAVSQLIEAALKLVLGLTFAYFGIRMRMSIPMISALCVLGITVGSMVCCVYLYILFKNMFNGEKAGQNYTENKKSIDRSIFKIAIPISFGAAMLNLGGMIDLGVIMRKLTDSGMSADEANAIYGNYTTLAVPMINLVISIITPIMLAFLPKLAMSYNRGDRKVFLDELKTMTLINSVIAIPAAFGFFFYAFEILDILFSVNSAAVGAELLIYSSIGLIFLSLLTIVNSVLEAQGRIRLTVISLIIGSFVKVMSNLVLVERNGICGAPLGTVLSYAVSLIISLCAIRSSECRLQIICSAITDSLAAFLSFLMPYYFLFYSGMFSGFLGAFLCISLSVLVYFSFLVIKYLREIKWNEMLKMHKKDDERLDIQTKLSPLDLK